MSPSFLNLKQYGGSLGPCCYLRYRIATSPKFWGNKIAQLQLLKDALASANAVLIDERRSRDDNVAQCMTLLNGELVGVHTMKIVIGNKLLRTVVEENIEDRDIDKFALKREIEQSMNQLLGFANKYILSSCLPSSECEIFNGRAGFLKAIKFIQTELMDKNFGRPVVRKVLAEIWEEGKDGGGGGEFLLWKWKQKIHLGALHGICGILHTLLDFEEDLAYIDKNAWESIQSTVKKMDDYCLKSGNLAGTLKTTLPNAQPKKLDKLVQVSSFLHHFSVASVHIVTKY